MNYLLFFCLLLTSTGAFAHGDHDWRQDYEAYLSLRYESPLIFSNKSFISSEHSRIKMEFFKTKLAVLTGEAPYIENGKEFYIQERQSQKHLDTARSFLAHEYSKLGYEVSLHAFGSGVNFIAERKGKTRPEKVLILSSHIDSVGNKGANDNGTGTIGLLTVARALSSELSATVRILGFDREEVGLKGSDAYVASLRNRENIIGNINFEMMGVNARNDGAFHVIDCDRKESLFLSNQIKKAISDLNLGLSVVKACTTRSDHASFWRRKIPAVVISENFFGGDADPCYHAKCDVMDERLNYTYMQNILSAVLQGAEQLAK